MTESKGKIKLHLGCGKRDFGKDWIHIDGSNHPHIKSHDIKNLPYNENTVDMIYASHVLEYFDREEVLKVLAEWRRVLKKGGLLRLAVPDFGAMAKLYISGHYNLETFLGPLYGKWKMTEYTTIYHKTTYDFASLSTVLEKCEFINPRIWEWRFTEHAEFDDYSQAYIPHMNKINGTLISLNIEANK